MKKKKEEKKKKGKHKGIMGVPFVKVTFRCQADWVAYHQHLTRTMSGAAAVIAGKPLRVLLI